MIMARRFLAPATRVAGQTRNAQIAAMQIEVDVARDFIAVAPMPSDIALYRLPDGQTREHDQDDDPMIPARAPPSAT